MSRPGRPTKLFAFSPWGALTLFTVMSVIFMVIPFGIFTWRTDYSGFSRIWIGSVTFRRCYSEPRFNRKFLFFPYQLEISNDKDLFYGNTSATGIGYTERAGPPSSKILVRYKIIINERVL